MGRNRNPKTFAWKIAECRGLHWRGENTHHAALNFYPIFIPLFEAKVSGVSVQDML
jgi:hypothetical protein